MFSSAHRFATIFCRLLKIKEDQRTSLESLRCFLDLLQEIPFDDFRTVEQESIQIHKLENEQWVTSSNIGQKVALYYSNFPGFQIDPHLSQQLGVIYQLAALEEDNDSEEQDFQNLALHVELPYVQQQVRVNDSGLFAIAFAVHLARGEDLTTPKYDQQQMREHLAKCFRRKSLTPFPLETNISNKQRPSKRRGTTIELCRMCLMPATYRVSVHSTATSWSQTI